MNSNSKIFNTLKKLNLTSETTRFVYNKGTRDIDDLIVWKDKISGIIYIDDFYTGKKTYEDGVYRNKR